MRSKVRIMMNREDVLSGLDYLIYDDSFMNDIQSYLRASVINYDEKYLSGLLKLGANPDINPIVQYETSNDGFLHYLCHKYKTEHTLHGDKILRIIEILLDNGANPDQAGTCNKAPIQRCSAETMNPVKELLLKYGANPEGNPVY